MQQDLRQKVPAQSWMLSGIDFVFHIDLAHWRLYFVNLSLCQFVTLSIRQQRRRIVHPASTSPGHATRPMSSRSAPSARSARQDTTSSRHAPQRATPSASLAPPPSALQRNSTPSLALPTGAQAQSTQTLPSAAKSQSPMASHAPPTPSSCSPASFCLLLFLSIPPPPPLQRTPWPLTYPQTGPSTHMARPTPSTFTTTKT